MGSEDGRSSPSSPTGSSVRSRRPIRIHLINVLLGATSILEPTERSWGDRVCGFVDPFDNRWRVATHLREFS